MSRPQPVPGDLRSTPGPRYVKRLQVNWGDLDANGHMANTAYLAKAADVRMFFFEAQGFAWTDFVRLGIGPVIQRDILEYRKELRMHETIDITLAYEGMSNDGARWILANEFYRADGELAAKVTSQGGWLDLAARALALPPPALLEIQQRAPRGAGFAELPGLRR